VTLAPRQIPLDAIAEPITGQLGTNA